MFVKICTHLLFDCLNSPHLSCLSHPFIRRPDFARWFNDCLTLLVWPSNIPLPRQVSSHSQTCFHLFAEIVFSSTSFSPTISMCSSFYCSSPHKSLLECLHIGTFLVFSQLLAFALLSRQRSTIQISCIYLCHE